MIRTVSRADLNGFRGSGIVVRDHFRKVPENAGGAHYCLGPLRTLAETTIEVGSGFPMHDHAEMEIVSYVCQGTLAHEDTLGHRGRLGPGDVQAMTTGTGIRHSEVNAGDVPVRLYQVWIEPDQSGLAPSYVDVPTPKSGATGVFKTLASGMPEYPGGAPIQVNAAILSADLLAGTTLNHALGIGRQAYVVAAKGAITLNGTDIAERDAAELSGMGVLEIMARDEADVLIFDMPI